MMNRATQRLLPTEINNEFHGSRLALWLFYPFTLLTLWRSQHHLLAPDGGAQSIATIPLDSYSAGAVETIIGIFALWGLSQLIIGLVYLMAAIRYRSLIPLLYLLAALEYLVRMVYISGFKPLETSGTAPGATGNLPLFLFAFVMLLVSLWTSGTAIEEK